MVAARAVLAATLLFSTSVDAQGERVPESAVVNGVPQGIFVGRSLLTGRAVCLLFLSGGRITRAIPDGGLESFDWARHRAAHSGDSGTWQMRAGQLVVTWGDGGVHQGPVSVNPEGIEFYGKRYAKAVPAAVGAIAGRWESERGTAITGGQGINRLSELVIQADGRYQWGSTTGGVVSGRAVASDRTMAGQLSIQGATIILRSDAGTTSSHTFLPVAGQQVTAFSLDANMFTRVGPAPAVAVPAQAPSASSASPSSGATSYQGLYFATPMGWTSGVQQGRFMLAPSSATPGSVVIVVLSSAERLNGRPLGDWLAAKMSADLTGGLKALQTAPPTRGRSGALETLSGGRTVQDQKGTVLLQVYHAISDGQQAGLAMVTAVSEAAMKIHLASVQSLLQSLAFGVAPNAGANSPPASSASGTATGQKKDLTMADVAGYWGHSGASYAEYVNSGSSTIAWNDGYELLPDGTYLYSFAGMVNLQRIREKDSGRWGFERGNLVIRSNTGRKPKEYYILGYQVAPDGVVFMTVLDAYYPRTRENIEMWAEKWVKKGK